MINNFLSAIFQLVMLLHWVMIIFLSLFRCRKVRLLVLKTLLNLITMFNWLLKRRSKAQVNDVGCEVQYCAVINDKMQWFNSQKEMFDYIEHFGAENIIYKLSMFRHEIHQLKQE